MSTAPKDYLATAQTLLQAWQSTLCDTWLSIDTQATFHHDPWRSRLGQGETRIIQNGSVFEGGGVNFSTICADSLPASALPGRSHLAGLPYQAMGVSVVMHPHNPYVPTSHANLRFFLVDPHGKEPVWWFGGGFDCTPYYGFEKDCVMWHQKAYDACAPYGDEVYAQYKTQCDRYFYLPHRNEHRGIGGLFFDNVSEWGFDRTRAFIEGVGAAYLQAYSDIVRRRASTPYGKRERDFQCYRRGRYVEFNLLHDRGTKFGIDSGGRTESIFMSLPPVVHWQYNRHPEPGSAEAGLTTRFLVATDWLSYDVADH